MTHGLRPQSRWMRILGVAFVMYVLSYVDRTNIAMAIPSMQQELSLSAASIGFATSMFFWGYIILQIPAGRLAGVWSAKRVIAGLLVVWSGVSLTTAFVHTERELIANRFALGIAEGGVLTCTIVLIRSWFTRAERARANTFFLLSLAVAPVVANPISGFILSHATGGRCSSSKPSRRSSGGWSGGGLSMTARVTPSGSTPRNARRCWRRSKPKRGPSRRCAAIG